MKRQIALTSCVILLTAISIPAAEPARGPLDPVGKIHIPTGIANTVDTLKTFVEAEGVFSPGFGTYGIYFWVYDPVSGKLTAPTMDGVKCEHGLGEGGALIPWSKWSAGEIDVKTEVCEVQRTVPAEMGFGIPSEKKADVLIAGARVILTNHGKQDAKVMLYAALRPLGPAGWPVKMLSSTSTGNAMYVDQHVALWASESAARGGTLTTDTIGELALAGKMPEGNHEKAGVAESATGDCSGALRFEWTLAPGETKTVGFVCPVLPGRHAVGHKWDGVSKWAQFDLNVPNPAEGGVLQADPGHHYWATVKADELFAEARAYWKNLTARASLKLPDPRWAECFAAITGHAAMCMNEGAPDVTVINYNVFNRDGVYVASILQKSGNADLAALAIDYFIQHPFNGRLDPEADNPGQILWIMNQHWMFTHDKAWLEKIFPSAKKIAEMIQYYRTTPQPHWVDVGSLNFGDELPAEKRRKLVPGACDGLHPEYTEAFDLAGIRAAIELAKAFGKTELLDGWRKLEETFAADYDKKYGAKLRNGYGSYSVLWPCRIFPYGEGKGFEQFKGLGAQKSTSWRYFPLATAHQGLLAGNREAGFGTLENHLKEEQMRGWYAFDEGGKSGSGGWKHVRTTWNGDIAMPHGWAIAEMQLLLRDSLVFEDGKKLVLFGGVPVEWFKHPDGMSIFNLPTHGGNLMVAWKPTETGAKLTMDPCVYGYVLRLPIELKATIKAGGVELQRAVNGDVAIPEKTFVVEILWAK